MPITPFSLWSSGTPEQPPRVGRPHRGDRAKVKAARKASRKAR